MVFVEINWAIYFCLFTLSIKIIAEFIIYTFKTIDIWNLPPLGWFDKAQLLSIGYSLLLANAHNVLLDYVFIQTMNKLTDMNSKINMVTKQA